MSGLTIDWTNSADADDCIRYAIQDVLNEWDTYGYSSFRAFRRDLKEAVDERYAELDRKVDDLQEEIDDLEDDKTALDEVDDENLNMWIDEFYDDTDATLPPRPS